MCRAEQEGDGYARLRVLFSEATQSVRIMEQALSALQNGSIHEPPLPRPGAALGWVEAPRGGAFHWVRLNEDGRVARYRIIPPSLRELAWLPSRGRKVRVPGFPNHALHF